jgi:hypothetical protein
MLADVPSGVGTGNSGRVYMDWYQPLTAREGYRTLVNSYLTFATEQELAVFGGCLIMCGVFWQLVNPQIEADGRRFFLIKVVVCGSLLAFLTAGFFSTTMESPVLWIPPLMAGSLQAWVFWRSEKNWPLIAKQSVTGVSLAVLAVLLIYGMGCYFGSQEDLDRQFHFKGGELVSAQLRSKPAAKAKSMALWVDHEVLGNEYGKALRQILAQGLASEMEVFAANAEGASDAQWLVYCGSRCVLPKENDRQRVVWMMPSLAAWEKLETVSPPSPGLKVITSRRLLERGSGRVLENLSCEGRVLALGGAEKNVLWYWDEILNSGFLEQAE